MASCELKGELGVRTRSAEQVQLKLEGAPARATQHFLSLTPLPRNCKFLVVGKNIFLEVLKECLEMMRFFNINLPGLSRLEYTNGVHPCVYFQERVFPPGFDFMIEGIVSAEPAAFLIRNGAVQFQRHKYASENWAYAYRHTPLAPSRLPERCLGVYGKFDEVEVALVP
ncbi:unnamed protein product [Symbiodinium pilosum]|uniref:Cyclic nucleotide-binding domain-containing protein n=1 Tax=Symbiodinium pilosum TaxID=2952 RepID=A0A812SHY3_SYMPI|nr:unnamed protein product [Symbiodinium pilosum]